ncbi:hypothetical protein OG749_05320 [Streptomyces nojiriensis]|uniref:cyanobactin maturation protease PatG family protein n=1 Tax=Streptomyces nojiriensis TaxID=66374 RepID=UPI002E17A19C
MTSEITRPETDVSPESPPEDQTDTAAVRLESSLAPQQAPHSADVDTAPPAASDGPSFVYAIGRIEPQFPSLSSEKEFAQVAGVSNTVGLTDPEVLQRVLSDPANRYLARQMAWVLVIESMETYLLVPRDPADIERLIESVRPAPKRDDVDVVVGVRGPLAPPELARGLVVPIVYFDQIYSFDTDSLIRSIPRDAGNLPDKFDDAARSLFERMVLVGDNAGGTDAHRALNYLVLRYPLIYARSAEQIALNSNLVSVDVHSSSLGNGVRRVVDVVFNFTNRATDVTESFFVRVDVTEEFPFLVTKLSPYIRR